MSLIPHSFVPRSLFDRDLWWGASHPGALVSPLDAFDPFDELDRQVGRNIHWLTRPEEWVKQILPQVPEKYRISLDIAGFSPQSIKTELLDGGRRLVVSGHEGHKKNDDDYHHKEFKKTYTLPANAEGDKLVSFVAPNDVLVIEVPLRVEQLEGAALQGQELFPKLVEQPGGGLAVHLKLALPANMDPAKISVTCKDRDLIIKGEDKTESQDRISSVYYYKRTTFPENTDFKHLKASYDDNHVLSINAPVVPHHKDKNRTIPVEYKKADATPAAIGGAHI